MAGREILRNNRSFTLVELLIVIGILAVLTTAVLLVINPVEYLKQTRDAVRTSDLGSINQALSVLETQGVTSFGTANTVYVSVADSSTTCANLGLPSLPAGYAYACVASSTLQKVDGTGWIPVNFTQSPTLAMSTLPIDPVNTTSTGNYYTYIPGGSWELNSIFESNKYRTDTDITKKNLPGVYSKGTNLTLSPIYNTSGLVGYWKFDEGSGTSNIADSSGSGNIANFVGAPVWSGSNNCKIGSCLRFPQGNNIVQISDSDSLDIPNNITIAFWIKYESASPSADTTHPLRKFGSTVDANYIWYYCGTSCGNSGTMAMYATYGGSWTSRAQSPVISAGNWYFVVWTYSNVSGGSRLYWNGDLNSSADGIGVLSTNSYPVYIGNDGSNNLSFYMDDIRIYNRALSASEIKVIYNATQ